MRVRLAKTESGGVATGRHRLPRDADCAVPVTTSPVSSSGAADADDFDDEPSPPSADTPASAETPADVDDSPGDDSARIASASVGARWPRVVAFILLPALLVVLGGAGGYLTWETTSAHFVQQARVESVRAATDGAVALLSYGPDTADKDLTAARERLTGKFKNSYTLFTHQQVIPDARKQRISSVVTVPSAASVRATIDHAVVMVFVNQTFLRDPDPPTSTASDVRVTLEKVGRRWLISEFTPV